MSAPLAARAFQFYGNPRFLLSADAALHSHQIRRNTYNRWTARHAPVGQNEPKRGRVGTTSGKNLTNFSISHNTDYRPLLTVFRPSQSAVRRSNLANCWPATRSSATPVQARKSTWKSTTSACQARRKRAPQTRAKRRLLHRRAISR